MSDHIGDTHEMVKGYVEARVTGTEEIRARVEKARPQESWATERVGLVVTHAEPNVLTRIWYDDGDLCAEVHDNLALGCDADAMAQLFANAVDDIPYLLTQLQALRQDNARLTKSLAAADAYFPATALEVVNLRQENERLKAALNHLDAAAGEVITMEEARYVGTTLTVEPWIDRLADAIHVARRAALSSSPAQEQKK